MMQGQKSKVRPPSSSGVTKSDPRSQSPAKFAGAVGAVGASALAGGSVIAAGSLRYRLKQIDEQLNELMRLLHIDPSLPTDQSARGASD